MAQLILESRLVLVTSLNDSKHSSFVGASIPILLQAPISILYFLSLLYLRFVYP